MSNATAAEMREHIKELDARIADLQRERKRVLTKALKLESPFKIGDCIRWGPHSHNIGKIISVNEDEDGKYWRVRVSNGRRNTIKTIPIRDYVTIA